MSRPIRLQKKCLRLTNFFDLGQREHAALQKGFPPLQGVVYSGFWVSACCSESIKSGEMEIGTLAQ